jgi:hypothetical protein
MGRLLQGRHETTDVFVELLAGAGLTMVQDEDGSWKMTAVQGEEKMQRFEITFNASRGSYPHTVEADSAGVALDVFARAAGEPTFEVLCVKYPRAIGATAELATEPDPLPWLVEDPAVARLQLVARLCDPVEVEDDPLCLG